MKKKNFSLTFSLILIQFLIECTLISTSYSSDQLCTLKLHEKIFIVNPNEEDYHFSDFLKSYNCPDEVLQKTVNLMKSYQGELKGSYLENILKYSFENMDFQIEPEILSVEDLETYIKQDLAIPFNTFLRKVSIHNSDKVLKLEKNEKLSITCSNCQSSGRKNLKILKINHDGSIKSEYFLTGEILEKKVALVSKNNAFVSIKVTLEELFEEKYIETNLDQKLFLDKEKLKYFKLNKDIEKGHILTSADLTPLNLINVGEEASIEVFHNGLSLRTMAIARNSGSLGKKVEFYNPKSKKHFSGIITDFNKAKISL